MLSRETCQRVYFLGMEAAYPFRAGSGPLCSGTPSRRLFEKWGGRTMSRKILAAILCLMMLAPLGALASAEKTLTDMTGREVKIEKPVERLIVMWPGDCEIVYALGAENLLVGVGSYCDYPEAVSSVEKVTPGKDMNLEQVIALKPDMVVTTTMSLVQEHVDALEKAGVRVFINDATNVEGVYTAIANLGALTGREAEAAALTDTMRKGFEAVSAKVPQGGELSVYYEIMPLADGPWAAGGGTFMDELGAKVGLKNIFGDQGAWAQVSEEQVLKANPAVIISTSYGDPAEVVKEITDRAAWKDVQAIRDGKVFCLDGNLFTRPAPRLVEAVESLFELLYGAAESNKAA